MNAAESDAAIVVLRQPTTAGWDRNGWMLLVPADIEVLRQPRTGQRGSQHGLVPAIVHPRDVLRQPATAGEGSHLRATGNGPS